MIYIRSIEEFIEISTTRGWWTVLLFYEQYPKKMDFRKDENRTNE